VSEQVSLPARDWSCGIRFESIGGLGADAAAHALAAAAVVKMGLDGTHLCSRRLERKGARVRSFVRLAWPGERIHASGAVDTPDAIVVFHAALLREAHTYAGLRAYGTLVYNAPAKTAPAELAALPATARAFRVDAAGIAAKEKCGMEAALLGALCATLDSIDPEAVLGTFCVGMAAPAVEAGTRAFRRGAAELEALPQVGAAQGDIPAAAWQPREAPAPGGVLAHPGDTIWNDVSSARSGSLPSFNRERCIHCALCDMVCPDACLVWEKGEEGGRFARELTGVDYRYCKGCLRCVETCPASAMLKKAETAGFASQRTVPLYPDLVE